MGKPVLSSDVGQKLCDVFGLDVNKVQSIRINLVAGEFVTVDAKLMVDSDDFIDEFKSYSLVEKEVTEENQEQEDELHL